MNQEEMFDKIDDYLWQLLPDSEMSVFEEALQNNAVLREEVAVRRVQYALIKMRRRDDLQAKMAAWDKEMAEQEDTPESEAKIIKMPQPMIMPRRLIYLVAAAVTALFIMLIGRSWVQKTYSNEALLEEFKPKLVKLSEEKSEEKTGVMPISVSAPTRNSGDEIYGGSGINKASPSELLTKAQQAFKNNNFDESINNCQSIFSDTTATSLERQQAEGQLLLSYLAKRPTDTSFQSLLIKIVHDTSHIFYKSAVVLQQKTHSRWWRLAN